MVSQGVTISYSVKFVLKLISNLSEFSCDPVLDLRHEWLLRGSFASLLGMYSAIALTELVNQSIDRSWKVDLRASRVVIMVEQLLIVLPDFIDDIVAALS